MPGHRELKIEENPSLVKLIEGFFNLVALALTVTELFSKMCEKVEKKERKKGRKRERKKTPGQKQNVSPSYGDIVSVTEYNIIFISFYIVIDIYRYRRYILFFTS